MEHDSARTVLADDASPPPATSRTARFGRSGSAAVLTPVESPTAETRERRVLARDAWEPEPPARPPRRASQRTRLLVLALLLACTLGARLPGAIQDALWQDEVGSEHVALERTLLDSIRQIAAHESTPPAYYLLARAVNRAGSGLGLEVRVQVLRSVSLLLSLVLTAATFVLACRLLPLWSAALAGIVVSFAGVLVAHGSELRSYPLLAAVVVVFALALDDAARRPSLRRLALLSGVVALGSLTHYFFLFTLGAGAMWLLLDGVAPRSRRRVGAALVVGLVPLVVWLPAWIHQYRNGVYATSPPFSLDRVLDVAASLLAPQALVLGTTWALRAVVAAVVVASALLLLRAREARLVALLALVPLLSAGLVAWITGDRIFNTRNLIGVAPFAAIALAWCCAHVPWPRVGIALGVVLAATVISGFGYGQVALGRTPFDRIADEMEAQGFERDDPILWFGAYGGIAPVVWYLSMDMPDAEWPRFQLAAPSGGRCEDVVVIARTATGRRWLDQHRARVLASAAVPSYGDVPQGRRLSDIVVARVSWFPRALGLPIRGHARFTVHRSDGAPACLVP